VPRLFTAIAVPDQEDKVLDQFVLASENVRTQETKHITLQFIGNVSEVTAAAIEQDLHKISMTPFEVTVSGCEFFMSHGIKSILVAKVNQNQNLTLLHDLIGDILVEQGVELGRRQYKPHITLTRLKQPSKELQDNLQIKANKIALTLPVSSFVLYSVEADQTPMYVRRKEYLFE